MQDLISALAENYSCVIVSTPLARIKNTIGSMAYAQEYQLIPIALDDRIFREEYIKEYKSEELIGTRFVYVFSWTDSGVKYEDKLCYKSTVCAGITSEGIIYILKARIRKESVQSMMKGNVPHIFRI